MILALSRQHATWSGTWQARLGFWFTFALAVQAATTHGSVPLMPQMWDKYQHALGFGVLTTMALIAYPRMSLLRLGERMALFGAMIELVQSAPFIGRSCDFVDWVADMVAVGAVLLVARLLQSKVARLT